MQIELFGSTHTGLVRSRNEDAFFAGSIWDSDHYLVVVADGVGGYAGGEVAANLALDSIMDYLHHFTYGEREALLRNAVNHANNRVYNERTENQEYPEMSCVLTACLVDTLRGRAYMAHVGDTRLYLLSDKILKKVSHDHSVVGYREEIGELSETEAMAHPQRNVILRAIGPGLHRIDDEYFIETASFPVFPGNQLLLCSDGLTDMLTTAAISAIIRREMSVEERVYTLIEEANKKGGKDNITLVLMEFRGSAALNPILKDSTEAGAEVPGEKPEDLENPEICDPGENEKSTVWPNSSSSRRNTGARKPSVFSGWSIQRKWVYLAVGFLIGFVMGFGSFSLLTTRPAVKEQSLEQDSVLIPLPQQDLPEVGITILKDSVISMDSSPE